MKRIIGSILCLLFGLGTPCVHAQATSAPALTEQDASAWLDGMMPVSLAKGDLAGAVVVVVKDGKILTSKGYGYMDVASKKPVTPDATLFRPGSISKLFTWTAVMQQVEEGKIQLDADINAYLDFNIPALDGKPVTMRHLLTHTAGFDERLKNMLVTDPKKLVSNEAWLKAGIPRRIAPAGEISAYSNYGAGLAGYIVERVSGIPFDAYVEQRIFQPLGMHRSSFRQPLPPVLAPMMATGYRLASEPARGFEYVTTAPAGSLSATGNDMARFMIAHLQDGSYEGARILKPETVALMHTFEHHSIPALRPMALGFYRKDRNDQFIIGHAGDTEWFHSDLMLIRGQKVGVFVSIDGMGMHRRAAQKLRQGLLDGFVDRYYPLVRPPIKPLATEKAHGKILEGDYLVSRRASTSFVALTNVFPQPSIRMEADGTLATPQFMNLADQPRKWREVAPFVWMDPTDGTRLSAIVVGDKVKSMSFDDLAPIMTFQPAPFAAASAWNLPLLCLCIAFLALVIVSWPVAASVRANLGAATTLSPAAMRWYRASRIAAVAHLLFYVGWAWVLMGMMDTVAFMSDALDPKLRTIQLIGLVALILIPAAVMNAVYAWRAGRLWRKFNATLLALVCVTTLWFMFSLNLMTLSLSY
jgi:CubicO group peptidase (beta-lactamase class C family)